MTSTVFEFLNKPASVEAINVRKEGPNEGRVVAMDLKITAADLPLKCFAAVLGAPVAEVEAAFWRIEEMHKVDVERGEKLDRRFMGLGALKIPLASYVGKHELTIANLPAVKLSRVDKFELTPIAGETVVATFRATVLEPTDEFAAEVMHVFRETCDVSLVQLAKELDLDGDDSSATERKRRGGRKAKGKDAAAGAGTAETQLQLGQEGNRLEGPQDGVRMLEGPKDGGDPPRSTGPRRLGLGGPRGGERSEPPGDVLDGEFTEVKGDDSAGGDAGPGDPEEAALTGQERNP